MSSALNSRWGLTDQQIIDNFKNKVGDISINSLEDLNQVNYSNLVKFFKHYPSVDDRIRAYKLLIERGYIKGNTEGKFNGFKHSHDETVDKYDDIRLESRDKAKTELDNWLSSNKLEHFDKMPKVEYSVSIKNGKPIWSIAEKNLIVKDKNQIECVNSVSNSTWQKINGMIGNLYDLIHLKHFIKIWNEKIITQLEREIFFNYVPELTNRKVLARDLENNIVYEGRPNPGHQRARDMDLKTNMYLKQYSQEKLSKKPEEIDGEIDKLKNQIISIDPLSLDAQEEIPNYNPEDDQYAAITYSVIRKNTPKCQQKEIPDKPLQPDNKKSKYLVEAKDYEKLYMKYKAKYLELKKQLNM